MLSWMVSNPSALLWATAEVGDLRAMKTLVQLLPSKTRAITMKINKQTNSAILSLRHIGVFHLHHSMQDVSLPVWEQCPDLQSITFW